MTPVRRGSVEPFGLSGSAALAALTMVAVILGAPVSVEGQETDRAGTPTRVVEPIAVAFRDADGDGLPDRLGDTVTVKGVAQCATGEISPERLEVALDDGTAGVILYGDGFTTPIARGDTVLVTGVVASYRGQEQVTYIRYRVVGHGPPPEPLVIRKAPADLEKLEGRLVHISAEVVSPGANPGGQFLSVTPEPDWGRPLLVYVRARSRHVGMLEPFGAGDHVEVTGILSQYDPVAPFRSGYELLPRDASDLSAPFLTHKLMDRAALAFGLLTMLLIGWVWALRRQVSRQTEAVRRTEGERHRLEMLLQERRRLEMLGDLAGGIAHEFNNLLVGVMANAGLLAETETLSHEGRDSLAGIEAAAQKAGALTRQMLSFAGRSYLEIADVALDELVTTELPRLRALMHPGFEIETRLASVPPVRADAGQIRDILHALVTNAAEASAGKPGKATISTAEVTLSGKEALDLAGGVALRAGHWVTLAVEDNGPGMDAEATARAFDPYFSTKFHRQGLGLPAALGVLRSLGGGMAIRSAEGSGTEVTLYLPQAGDEESAT